MVRGVTLRLILVAALACPAFAPLSMDLKVDGVEADAAPMEGQQQPVAAEPTGRSLGGRIRTMAEDLIPTAIIDKVAEMRKPKDTDGEQTQVQDDGGTLPRPMAFGHRKGTLGISNTGTGSG